MPHNCLTCSSPHLLRCLLEPAPAESEGLLLSHSPIQDVAVIGVPDIKMAGDELPHAYVVANQRKITSDAIKSIVKDNLASHKQLRRGGVLKFPKVQLAKSFESNCAGWLHWKSRQSYNGGTCSGIVYHVDNRPGRVMDVGYYSNRS